VIHKQCILLREKVIVNRAMRKGRNATKLTERQEMAPVEGETNNQQEQHMDDRIVDATVVG